MWEKALFFNDEKIAHLILTSPDPRVNKELGRSIKNFDSKKWSKISYDIMVTVNYAKFDQNKHLKNTLLSTKDKTIVEASPHDMIWGIGLYWTNDDCLNESKWRGQNLLGKALMDVRKLLN
jgi:hypothetical protein